MKQAPFHQNNPFMQGRYDTFFKARPRDFIWSWQKKKKKCQPT